MADQEAKQDERGDGQPEKEAEPSSESERENKLDRLKGLFAKDLEYMGLFVFAIAAVALVLFVGAFNFIPSPEERGSYHHLRSAEFLLTLAATGLVVAILGRAANPFVLAFGIFLIGALIVPSTDIVRFALIASGSDRNYESFFHSAGSGTDLGGRSTDVANKILTELTQYGLMENLDPEDRKRAIQIIEGEVRKEREITLLEQISSRGALETLNATASDIEGWVYKYGREEKFIEDLMYLRSEGLISFAYEDFDTIAPTSLGHAVMRRATASPVDAAVSSGSGGSASTSFLRAISELSICPPNIDLVPDLSEYLLSTAGRVTRLEQEFEFMRIQVPQKGNYRIDVEAQTEAPESAVDPILVIFDLQTEDFCNPIAFDDDSGESLNSQLFIRRP